MTPDEARKLVGGYATGSLTEAERSALFQAALKDQDLFDELAGEQALKDALEESGTRQRLLAALEPPAHRAAWWLRPWPWAAVAVTLATVIGIVVSQRTPQAPPPQIAQVMKSPEPVGAPAAPKPARAPVARKAPPPPPPIPPVEERAQLADKLEAEASAR